MAPDRSLTLVEHDAFAETRWASVNDLLVACFDGDGLDPASPATLRTVAWIEDRPVASAACLARRFVPSPGAEAVDGALVAYICSDPSARGGGHALAALSSLMGAMRERGLIPGVLNCVPALCPFYARLGWERIADRAGYDEHEDPDPVMAWDAGRPVHDLRLDRFAIGSDW